MTPASLIERRKAFGFNQTEMAEALGITLRGYQKIEASNDDVRQVYELAVAHIALERAVALGNPMLAPKSARKIALDFAKMLTG